MSAIAEAVVGHEPKHTVHLKIIYNGMVREVEINREATVKALLDRAIALFGNIPQPHTLALWTEKGLELTNEQDTLKAAGVMDGESLILRPSAVKGGK
jgi:hypothetical protein